MKTCALCEQTKSNGEFNESLNQLDGYQGYCRFCQMLYQKLHRKYNLTAEEIREKIKAGEIEVPILIENGEDVEELVDQEISDKFSDQTIVSEALKFALFPNAVSVIAVEKAIIAKYEEKEDILKDIPTLLHIDKTLYIEKNEIMVM
jgi:hypothetical protein